MSYESAPATKMLATSCACCGRPLVDAKSVECGVGPECRKKHGFDAAIPEACRRAANVLVYQIACDQQSIDVLKKCEQIRLLGLDKLAGVIEKRVAPVRLFLLDGELRIVTPYNPDFVNAVRAIPGRRWHKEEKLWSVPLSRRAELWSAMSLHYNGKLAIGPKGPFVVGQIKEAA